MYYQSVFSKPISLYLLLIHYIQKSMHEESVAISLQPAGNGSNGHSEFAVSKELSVDEAIDAIGAGKFQWKILCVTGLFWAADAIEIMRLTFLLPIWKDEWELDDGIDGTIGAVVFAGISTSK